MSFPSVKKQQDWVMFVAFCLFSILLPQHLIAQDTQLQFTQVSTLPGIVDITNAGDGSDRVFLVEQAVYNESQYKIMHSC